jgi:putative glycosyl hydrolase
MARPAARSVPRFVIVVAGLFLSLLAASPAGAARTEFFGIAQGPALDAQDLQGMAAARVRTDRFLLLWRGVQPSRGSFNWGATDLLVGTLASHGIRPVPFVWGSPSWVGSGALNQAPTGTADKQAWRDFLKAAVARYGPGGSYWGAPYHQKYGSSATPLPVQSWQIWNEPNLKRFWAPSPSSQQYARLVEISHDAIKSQDPQARIVLAGLFSDGDVKAGDFLRNLYQIPGTKGDFDAAALHPYGCNRDQTRQRIVNFRAVMTNHADGGTPLWLTEFAWGSGPPDRFCKNKGLAGQQQLLSNSFKMILNNRRAWNVQRLFWFLWRDPAAGSQYARSCSICGTAGLLRYDRSPKPAYGTFRGFTAETTPPVASITSGPSQGSFTKDSTPTFSFASNEPGSTFVCHFDATSFKLCSSPLTRVSPLLDGAHTFFVKAIDAPGNASAVRSRSFTVDTLAPQTTITSGPANSSTTTDNTPTFSFTSSELGSTFQCRFDSEAFAACSGPSASHTPSTPLSNGSHSFEVRATDRAKNTDATPAKRTFTVVP